MSTVIPPLVRINTETHVQFGIQQFETQPETEEQFQTAHGHLVEEDGDHSADYQSSSKSTHSSGSYLTTSSEAPETPFKTRPQSLLETPQQPPTTTQGSDYRRRLLLDEDDGFEHLHGNEFCRERQAEFFVQSDTEWSDEEESNEEENGGQTEIAHDVKNVHNVKNELADQASKLEELRNTGDFAGFEPVRFMRHGQAARTVRVREKFTPSEDRLLLESSNEASKRGIPLKELFKQLTGMIGHTEASLQTRLSKLDLTEGLRHMALNAPVLEEFSVSEVLARTKTNMGPKTRARIPFSVLDDLSIKAFVYGLNPAKRGFYTAYEPFAAKYTHHSASSVKGRWMKTLRPKTSETELLEARQRYTLEVERKHMEYLQRSYPDVRR